MSTIVILSRSILLLFLAGYGCLALAPATPATGNPSDEYLLGSGDHLGIAVPFADEINNKAVVVDSNGYINIPFAGRVHAAGLTTRQLETDVGAKLTPYFEDPHVVVNVVEYGSKPVSVVGEVHNPAVHQLQGRVTLMQILSSSGGLTQDAGSHLEITRELAYGPLPLPTAHADASGKFSTGEIDLGPLLAGNPAENIFVYPNDVITVPRARLIYVLGEVHKPGGFPLRDTESATVLQALALAEGPLTTAGMNNARILRTGSGGTREGIPVNLRKVLGHELPDVPLKAEDILYIPNSKAKSAALRGLETAIQIGTGVVVWGRY